MKIIFLDVDGCINSEDYAVYRYETKQFNKDQFIDERAVAFLNYLIDQTEAKVVLSSSWRGSFEETENRFKAAGFKYEFFDKTPYLGNRHRGSEIKAWIEEYEKNNEPLESYVIIDDDNDILEDQEKNFVQCNFIHGLTSVDCYKAIGILNNDIEDTNENENFVPAVEVSTELIDNIIKYCETQAIYDKLGPYGDFYYKLKQIRK